MNQHMKTLARRQWVTSLHAVVAGAVVFAIPMASASTQIVVEEQAVVKPPPGHELHETLLCLQERRVDLHGRHLPPKTSSIPLGMFVPRDRCVALGADGLLRVVPGDCPVHPPKVSSCN